MHVCKVKDPTERTDEHGRRHFQRGSAAGMAWIELSGEGDERVCHFHCAAHVMDLPSDRELLHPLYRELLELNWDLTGVPRAAIRNSEVWVLYSEQSSLMDSPVRVVAAIDQVMGLADALDDHLMKKYGGTSATV